MKYTIAQLLLFTLVIAIPIAMMCSSSDTVASRLMGLSQFVIATSLAAPVICAERYRPFWAGYAITTAFATLAIGSDRNAILDVLMEPLQWLQGWLSERGSQWAIANALSVWAAPMLGVASGVVLQLFLASSHVTQTATDNDQIQRKNRSCCSAARDGTAGLG